MLCPPPEEVRVDVREAMVLSQGEQDARWTATLALPAEAAVADAAAGRTLPLLQQRNSTFKVFVLKNKSNRNLSQLYIDQQMSFNCVQRSQIL